MPTPPLSGVLAWYDASGLSAGALGTWSDESGNGYDATQATSGDQPTVVANSLNGLPAVSFNGTSDYMGATIASTTQPFTVFAVVKSSSASLGPSRYFGSGGAVVRLGAGADGGIYAGGTALTGGAINGTFHLTTAVVNGASSLYRIDESQVFTGNPGTNGLGTSIQLGANGAGGQLFTGYVCEVLVYPSALSSTDYGTVESYLNNKWFVSTVDLGTAAVSATGTAAATLNQTLSLTAALSAAATATGALNRTIGLTGAVTATGTITGTLNQGVPTLKAAVAATGTIRGTLTVTIPAPVPTRQILTRERPPLKLSIEINTPDGPSYRWAQDSKQTRDVPDALTFTTAMPGGFDQANCTLERSPRIDWPDLQELSNVTINGLGGSATAWQGRIEEFPSQAGQQAAVSPTMVGWQAALQDDNSAAMVYIDQALGGWQAPSVTRQLALAVANKILGATAAANDPAGTPALVQTITNSWVSPFLPLAEAWYDAGPNCLIAKVAYIGKVDTDVSTTWVMRLGLVSGPNLTSTEYTSNLNTGSQASGTFQPTTPYRYAIAQWSFPTTPAGTQGATANAYWTNLAVIGNHGLALQGSSGSYGLLASDVIAHAVNTWASSIQFTTGSQGSIQPSSFVVPQLVFTPTSVSQIITQASQYELLDWAVWEPTLGTTGPTLFVNQRGARGNQWTARVGPAQLQNAGPQASRIWNGVVVQYTDPSGTVLTVGPPGSGANSTTSNLLDSDPENPANKAGIVRYQLIQANTETLASATAIGETFLTESLLLNTSGQATIQGHVQDPRGAWWPAWMIRAGDTISFVDAADSSYRRIVSTSYDDSTRQNTLQLDVPPNGMQALLDRLSVVLAPLGLT